MKLLVHLLVPFTRIVHFIISPAFIFPFKNLLHKSCACTGSELVDWLCERVQGFSERKDARHYAALLLEKGFIKHTVKKTSFSEKCYYVLDNELMGGK